MSCYDPNTIRILELDGGGERGYLSWNFLQLFLNQWLGTTSSSIASYFDVICGTSIGGIMALALASGRDPSTLGDFFTVQGPWIFTTDSGTPSVQVTGPEMVYAINVSGIPFYATDPGSTYGSGLLVSTIDSFFGSATMQSLKTNVVIPTYLVNPTSGDYYLNNGVLTLCSNVNNSYFVGQNELIKNVALVTSAAPFYLPSMTLSNTSAGRLNGLYTDGGIWQNNPVAFGRNLAQMLKPTANRCCILSIGTGLVEIDYNFPTSPNPKNVSSDPLVGPRNVAYLFDPASTGAQEGPAANLYLESKYTLSQLYYYRFQPTLDPAMSPALDNTSPEILDYYVTTANNWFYNDQANINTFIGHLSA